MAPQYGQRCGTPESEAGIQRWGARDFADLMASQSPTSTVRLSPPRSGVTKFSGRAARPAVRSAAASGFQPRNSNIIAEARTEPKGLAMRFPAILGADPCTGSSSDDLPGAMFPDGPRPR